MEDSHIRRTLGDGGVGCSSYFLGVEKEVLVLLREFSLKEFKAGTFTSWSLMSTRIDIHNNKFFRKI